MPIKERTDDKSAYKNIFRNAHNPLCIFNAKTREITERNVPYSTLFDDGEKTVDELFWDSRTEYETFIRQLETEHSAANFTAKRESGDKTPIYLLISPTPLTDNEILLNIADITEWKYQERITRIQCRLGSALASCSSVFEALKLCFEALKAVSGMDAGWISRVEKETGEVVLTYSDNLSDNFVKALSHPSKIQENPLLIARTVPQYFTTEEISSILPDAAREDGLSAVGLIPVFLRDQVIGSIGIASRSLRTIPDSARHDLEMTASQAGDVIVRIQADEENAKSRADMQAFFNSIQDIIFVSNSDGQILHANRAAGDYLGYSYEDLLEMTILDVHPLENREETLSYMDELLAGKRDFCPIPLLKSDKTRIPVETKVTRGRWGGNDVLFCISRDITEREKAKEMLERRDAILKAVSVAAHGFLKNNRWDDQIDDVLEQLGRATDVDRVYLFQNHTDDNNRLLCSQRHEWSAPGVEAQIDNSGLQDVDFIEAGFSRWIEVLKSGNVLSGDIDTFPEGERELLRSQGILSLVVVPVISDTQWWGYLGFDECRRNREWSLTEIDALHVAADILGSAIYQTTMREVFKQPVERSFVGTYLLYNDTIEYINPRFAEIFGYEVSELIHMKNIEKLFHPDEIPVFWENVRKRLSGEVESVHYEFRGRTKSNEIIYLEAYGSTIEFRGQRAIIGNIMDITERKLFEKEIRDSLDEKVILLNEIHHRVKNNLQIISAFVRLQMMYMDDRAELQGLIECDNWILTMALIHESLYKSNNFTHIHLKDHVNALIQTIGHPDGRPNLMECDPDVEDIILPLDAAMPCSLIITEFINFAQKCSPAASDKRKISIIMRQMPDSSISMVLGDEIVCLPPESDLSVSDSLELELIQTLVRDQLRGTITLQRDNGMKLFIVFPASQG